MSAFSFDLHATDGRARTGVIHTPRGDIRTPAFMPVGTAGTVKAMYSGQVREAGADIILGNTYHLMLRPGAEQVHELGGLHTFANWPHPILTDSGGFQVMSLSRLRRMSEQGVTFQSHIDGSRHFLSPERSIEIQCLLGSDIQMQLDECTPFPATEQEAEVSMRLSLRWAKRSKDAFETQPHRTPGMALFGIVQGSVSERLRAESAKGLIDIGFDGYSIGGLAVGEGQAEMLRVLDFTTPVLPMDRPRYLMGVGTPDDLVESVARGVDMFDCVMPTRSGRHGQAFTRYGRVNFKNARHAADPRPLDAQSACPAARDYSRAYLHHLVRCEEMLGAMLVSWINIHYYQTLMAEMRAAIAAGAFAAFREKFKADQARGDIDPL
ncbi:MAG: tRNA guanosine(34) transglycosylase Tgt [Parvibaculaceae bacterium]|nr:tRNA guanosine(34) transglycosylase Tgt [Parvibaculaceae bacterium]